MSAVDRGLRWLLAMQNRDGGWAAFDRNNDREFLCHVPFADHNAMIDPSSPDLTGRVLEALASLGHRLGDPAVDRAVAYVRRTQNADGSWFGRWGVNYIYGTWQSLVGLIAVGVPTDDPMVVAGANWLLSHQQACGGWGESPESYEFPHLRGQGSPTASQTAWALMGLLAAGLDDHPAVARGVRHLLRTQNDDGTWDEPEFTGTGFPRVFYLRYHYYPIYFPLLALSQWAVTVNPRMAAMISGNGQFQRNDRSSRRSDDRDVSVSHDNLVIRHPSPLIPSFPPHAISPLADPLDDRLPAAEEAGGRDDVSVGADARAAARLQPLLHRLRTDSGIRRYDAPPAVDRNSAWRRWPSAARRS